MERQPCRVLTPAVIPALILAAHSRRRHSRPHSHPHSHIDGTHFSYNHASDVDRVDGAHSTNDTIDHATVWQGTLCERQHVADVDRATVWLRRTLRATACSGRGSGNGLAL